MASSQTSLYTLMGIAMLLAVITYISAAREPRAERSFSNKLQMDPKKRPFCNAFTGCGRKRSEIPPSVSLSQGEIARSGVSDDDSISSLLDLSAEPAVEDLSRQIMSEAKLWEAIQEANIELLRRKQEAAEQGNRNAGFSSTKCGLSTCFI